MAEKPRLVQVQFRVPFIVVASFQQIIPGREIGPKVCGPKVPGTMIVPSTKGLSLAHLPEELAHYQLLDAFWVSRTDHDGSEYFVVRFVFGVGNPMDSDLLNLKEFVCLCQGWTWSGWVYKNPYFLGQEVIPGEHTLMVEVRSGQRVGRHNKATALLHFDGNTVFFSE